MLGMARALIEDGLRLRERRLGVEGVAALPAEFGEVLGVQGEEAALREALVVDPAGVLAFRIRPKEGAAEEDLAAGPAPVALPAAAGEQGVGVLAQHLRLDEPPDLAAHLQA